MAITTKEKIVDAFKTALEGKVQTYAAQIPELDAATKKKVEALEAAIAAIGETSPASYAIKREIEQLSGRDKLERERMSDITDALVIAAQACGVDVIKRPSKAQASSSGKGKRQRMSRADLDEACKTVLKAMPPKGKKYLSKNDIAAKVGLPPEVVAAAIGKLKRQDKPEIASNGKRGGAGGWQLIK